jgi:hypothetical protein
VHSTLPDPPTTVRAEVLFAQTAADGARWSVETENELFSGVKIVDPASATIGGLVVVYPVTDLEVAGEAMTRHLGVLATVIAILGTGAAMAAVRTGLGPAVRTLARLDEMAARLEARDGGPQPDERAGRSAPAPLATAPPTELGEIERKLTAATSRFREAEDSLRALERSWDGVPVDPAGR